MKNLFYRTLSICLICISISAAAETSLESDTEKFSYAIGLQIAQSLVRQGVSIEPAAFALAVEDAVSGREPRLSAEVLQTVMREHEQKATENLRERAKQNLAAGRKFREENAKQEGMKVLESGLMYEVLKQGDGARPKLSDTVLVHYTGTLIDGREFDSSHRRGEPAKLDLHSVIRGWQEALQLMPVGSKWVIVVPPDLAYGAKGAGGVIGPNETLVFELELLSIVK